MGSKFQLSAITEYIARDEKFLFTLTSYLTVVTIFANLNTANSPLIGATAFLIFFLINGTFLARSFFEKETHFSKFMLGNLLLIVILGLISWAIMIIYNLDATRSAIVLCVVTALSSLSNKTMKPKNVNS